MAEGVARGGARAARAVHNEAARRHGASVRPRHERRRRRLARARRSAPTGRSIEVLEAGEGPPLLFLHGAGGIPPWEGVLPLLVARVPRLRAAAARLRPARPGSSTSTTSCDLFLHGFDVMEALGLERPYVVGESMGGWIAAEMAALRPKEIGRLALAAPDRPLARRRAGRRPVRAHDARAGAVSLPRPVLPGGAAHARR